MTVLILQLSEQMARRVAEATDKLDLASNEDLGLQAVGMLLDEVLGKVRGRKPMSERAKRVQKPRGRATVEKR